MAVDSDKFYLKSVRKKITRDGLARSAIQTFHYADIGLTEETSAARLESGGRRRNGWRSFVDTQTHLHSVLKARRFPILYWLTVASVWPVH